MMLTRYIRQPSVVVMLLVVTLTMGAMSRANAAIVTFDEIGVNLGQLSDGTNINGATFETLGFGASFVANVGNLDGNAVLVGSLDGIRVDFDNLYETVSVDISNSTPIYLDAYDSSGSLLGTSVLNTVGIRNTLSFRTLGSRIDYIVLHDSGFDFAFDNLIFNPEPSAIAVWATLIGGCALVLTRRRRAERHG